MKRGILIVSILAPLVSGCTTAATIHCPPLVSYTRLQQQVLGNELDADGPESQAQLVDYVKLRQACSKH